MQTPYCTFQPSAFMLSNSSRMRKCSTNPSKIRFFLFLVIQSSCSANCTTFTCQLIATPILGENMRHLHWSFAFIMFSESASFHARLLFIKSQAVLTWQHAVIRPNVLFCGTFDFSDECENFTNTSKQGCNRLLDFVTVTNTFDCFLSSWSEFVKFSRTLHSISFLTYDSRRYHWEVLHLRCFYIPTLFYNGHKIYQYKRHNPIRRSSRTECSGLESSKFTYPQYKCKRPDQYSSPKWSVGKCVAEASLLSSSYRKSCLKTTPNRRFPSCLSTMVHHRPASSMDISQPNLRYTASTVHKVRTSIGGIYEEHAQVCENQITRSRNYYLDREQG